MGECTGHDQVGIVSRYCRGSLVSLLVEGQSQSPSCLSVFAGYDLLTYGLVGTIIATDESSPPSGFVA